MISQIALVAEATNQATFIRKEERKTNTFGRSSGDCLCLIQL